MRNEENLTGNGGEMNDHEREKRNVEESKKKREEIP